MHFGNDPKPGDNRTRPIFVENDEYVVNRNASRKFKPLLDTLNFVVEPRFDNGDTAHSAIDEAIAMNFLSEMGMQEGGAIEEFKPSGALLRSFGLAGPPMLKTSGVTEKGKLRPDISTAKMAGFMEGMDRLGNLHGIRDNLDRAREMENEKMNRKRLMGDIEMMGDSLIDTDDKYLMDKTEFDYLASVPDSDKMGQQARMFELDRELAQMKADDMRKNELMKDIQLLGDVEVPEMPNFQDFPEASYRDGEFIPESLPRVISLGQENELLDIAKQSMAKQKEMENLSSLLSSNIISQMSENIPEQEIRRSSESPIDNISYSLGYQKGGIIEDKRDRKGGYSLGVKDYYAQALGEFEKMGDFVGGATGSNRRNILEAAQEAGAIMETQEALDALKLIANRHQQGTMGVMANPRKGYQYGGQTTTDYYQTYGQQFSDADEQQKFEELYGTFDPTEFLQQRGELAEAGQSALLRGLTQSTQQAAKSGLNIGAGQTPNYMTDAYKAYESGTQNILNQQLQQQEADALAYLAEADLGGADMEENPTMTSEQSSLPQFNTVPTEYVGGNIMVNLTQYKWDSEAGEYVEGVG